MDEWEELTKKDPSWKKNNWDKWTFWKKVRHIIAVILALFTSVLMALIAGAVLLYVFTMEGALITLRDTIIKEIVVWLRNF
jgi:hypothetical protein